MKIFFVLLFLSSCATHLQTTQLSQPKVLTQKQFAQRKFSFIVKRNDAEISGQHHEGILQVPQPWIFGLSKEQKDQLRKGAAELASEKIILELKNLGLPFQDEKTQSAKTELWTLEVTQVQIDTYGDGYHGFGSAGNYWKAINFYKIKKINSEMPEIIIHAEAVVTPCPAEMNALTILNLLQFSLKPSPLSLPEASYELKPTTENPVDLAARLAARDLLQIILAH